MDGRRLQIDSMSQARHTHVGLWLDRYCPDLGRLTDITTAQMRDRFYEQVEGHFPDNEFYRRAFLRWRKDVMATECVGAVVRAVSRLAVGLGGSSVMETGLRLHHTYGVPFLPGSALKGVARNYLLNTATDPQFRPSAETDSDTQSTFDILFGHQGRAGCVTFHDAWLLPNDPTPARVFVRDVITVHHANYYTGSRGTPPTGTGDGIMPPGDWDNPTPITYIDIRPDTRFLLLITGPEQWGKFAIEILLCALQANGIGAKTTSNGYGRLVSDEREAQDWRRFTRESIKTKYENVWNIFGVGESLESRIIGIYDVDDIERKSQLATAVVLSDDVDIHSWLDAKPLDNVKLRALSLDYVSRHGLRASYREDLIKAAFELVNEFRDEAAQSLVGKIPITELIEVAGHIGNNKRKRRAWEFINSMPLSPELLSAIVAQDDEGARTERMKSIFEGNTLDAIILAILDMPNREDAAFVAELVRAEFTEEVLLGWGVEHEAEYDSFEKLLEVE